MQANEFPDRRPVPWWERAQCKVENVPTEVFFPPRGNIKLVAEAKAVCARCPVLDQCLDDDLAFMYPYGKIVGIRAGLGGKERSHLRAELNRAAAAS